jgi:uncharacterized protein YggE
MILDNKLLGGLGVGLVIVLALTVSYIENNHASAQYAGNTPDNSQQTITVMGTATTHVSPDRVALSFAVETRNKTAAAALDENNILMQRVLDALQEAGVRQNDTQTANFNIMPNYQNAPMTMGPGNLTGYTVTNTIQITSSDLDHVSDWIDTAVNAGSNRVNNISFTLSEAMMKNIRNSLITQAIDDARGKADLAASAVGVKIIGVKSININDNFWQPQSGYMMMAPAMAINSGAPVIAGQQQVSTSVNITYLIG